MTAEEASPLHVGAVRPGPARGRAFGWMPSIALGVVSLGYLVGFLVGGGTGELLTCAAFAATAVPFLLAANDSPHRLLHPLSVFGFTMLIGTAGETALLTYLDRESHVIEFASPFRLLSGLGVEALVPGLLVICAGLAALVLGYCWSTSHGAHPAGPLMRQGLKHGLDRPSSNRTVWVILLLCTLAAGSFLVYAPNVGITSGDDLLASQKRYGVTQGSVTAFGYLRYGISLAGVGFILGVYTLAQNRMRWRSKLGAATIAALVLTVGYAFVTSGRTELFAVLAIAAFTAIAIRQSEPRPTVIVVVTMLVFGVLLLFAGARSISQGTANSLGAALASPLEQVLASGDWLDVAPTSVIVRRVPEEYDYAYGRTLVSVLWSPIPRSVWPEKPAVRVGPELGKRLFGFRSRRISGDPPGIIGELWLNGGLVGVVLGMAIVGGVLRKVEQGYRTVPATNGLSALPYGVLVVAVALQLPISDVTGTMLFVIQYAMALGIVLWLVRSPPGEGTVRTL